MALISGRGGWNAAGNALTVRGPSALGASPMPVFRTIELAFRQTYNNPDQHNAILLNCSGDELSAIRAADRNSDYYGALCAAAAAGAFFGPLCAAAAVFRPRGRFFS